MTGIFRIEIFCHCVFLGREKCQAKYDIKVKTGRFEYILEMPARCHFEYRDTLLN